MLLKPGNMNCLYHTLFADDTGYVVRCKDCGYYQIGFITSLLSLEELDFSVFLKVVWHKLSQQQTEDNYSKNILVETPTPGFCLILNRAELASLCEMLERADSEARAQDMISLFQ